MWYRKLKLNEIVMPTLISTKFIEQKSYLQGSKNLVEAATGCLWLLSAFFITHLILVYFYIDTQPRRQAKSVVILIRMPCGSCASAFQDWKILSFQKFRLNHSESQGIARNRKESLDTRSLAYIFTKVPVSNPFRSIWKKHELR